MKTNNKQKELIKHLQSILKGWATTNDINSPSHSTLISETLWSFIDESNAFEDKTDEEQFEWVDRMNSKIMNILWEIRKITH